MGHCFIAPLPIWTSEGEQAAARHRGTRLAVCDADDSAVGCWFATATTHATAHARAGPIGSQGPGEDQ